MIASFTDQNVTMTSCVYEFQVTYECGGISQPLFVVTGSCHGLEITLDSNHMPFGAVVQHSQSSRRVLMHNSGDIGASFRWEHDRFPPDFSIAPVDGYISPGMEVLLLDLC